MNNSYKTILIFGSIIAALLIGVSVLFALRDEEKKPDPSPSPTSAEQPDAENDLKEDLLLQVDGIITEIDLDSSSLTLCSLGTNEEYRFTFTGATDIRTRAQRIISATLLKKGDFVQAFYNDENRLMKLYGSDTVSCYKNVGNLQIDVSLKKMTIGQTIYRYDDSLKVLNGETFTTLDSISSGDILNIYSVDNYIYLIKIARGHGFLCFANDSDFIGGSVSYNMGKTVQLTEDFKLELAEGNYSVTVQNGEFIAQADIKISRDSITRFDLFDYGAKPVEYGTIHFNITPSESELYIDGVKTLSNAPVKLAYGEHDIEVSLGGYTSYNGTLSVDRTDITKNIVLSAAPDKKTGNEDILYEEENNNSEASDNDSESDSDSASSKQTTDSGNSSDSDISDDIPDTTTDDGDIDDIETIDGDKEDRLTENTGSASETEKQDGSNTVNNDHEYDISENDDVNATSENNDENGTSVGNYHGTFTIYCTNGTAVFVNDVYSGEISNGFITLDKPSGIVEIRLTKEGYVTKKYTITMDDDEAEQVFKFPDMTKSS